MTRLIYAASALVGFCAGIAYILRRAFRADSVIACPDLERAT